jgi:Skp family chaperone for outer membrane proteins
MRLSRVAPLGALALAAAIATTLAQTGGPAASPPATPPAATTGGTKIAVLDPQVVLDHMAEMAAIKAQFKQKQDQQVADENAKKAEIAQLQESRDRNLKPDTPPYNEISVQIDQKTADLQAWDSFTRMQDDRDQKQTLKTVYKEIQDAAARIAQQDGIDLVITTIDQDIPSVEKMTNDQLHLLLDERVVLYHSPHIDITQKVLLMLDNDFAKGGGVPPAPAPAPGPAPTPPPGGPAPTGH